MGLQAAPQPQPRPSAFAQTLPFGQPLPLDSLTAPVYVTAQLLVQQVAVKLSHRIYSASPETFDLDLAAKQWIEQESQNVHGYIPSLTPFQIRIGAGTLALGYIFSPDFDVTKRHIPQTLIAPSGGLVHLRPTLDQLSLLYHRSCPFVAHIAAVDYSPSSGLVPRYESALRLAEDLGLALVASSSAYEAQHMSLFATLLATLAPTLHIYDGTRVGRETLRVVDTLSEDELGDLYIKLAADVRNMNPRLDTAGKAIELLKLFNDDLGTVYQPFEYHGHKTPDVVLVAFGSIETQVAKQTLTKLANTGAKVGVVNVRLYRPFIEEAFLEVIPATTRTVAVLGQVPNEAAVLDKAISSALHSDVLTSVIFADKFDQPPIFLDLKYAPAQTLTPQGLADILLENFGNQNTTSELSSLIDAEQYIFWDVDDSPALHSPVAIGSILSKEPSTNVNLHSSFDNLVQRGIVRTDLRASKRALEAPYAITDADVSVVGDERLLKNIDVLDSVVDGGKVLLKLPSFKPEDAEKRLPTAFRRRVCQKNLGLLVLDISASPALDQDPNLGRLMLELCFLSLARPQLTPKDLEGLVSTEDVQRSLQECVDALPQCFTKFEVPAAWNEVDANQDGLELPTTLQLNSFAPFEKEEEAVETPSRGDWQTVAKALIFKEAYQTQTSLRPDLTAKTATIRVKENRRLTPDNYERNIFHIEFDLGDSGLTYNIGEALGIHAENDAEQVDEFVRWYGIDATQVVTVPSRTDPATLEVRTVHQALMQNVDILGKPPKRFYEALAPFATDATEKEKLLALGGKTGAVELKKRTEVDMLTYVDVLEEFPSARPAIEDLMQIVDPLKRREYSIASAQAVTPTTVALMIVVVDWVDSRGRTRYGQATRYLSRLQPGALVTASVKPSVMKLPERDTAPLIMAGLGTGLAPFRAFVQYRAMQKAQGKEIGSILLYLGSRHQREEYLYGEEWEAYLAAGVVTLVGSAFSRDQPEKIYIQDRMRQTLDEIVKAYVREEGSFYLCGPTWPVPDVTAVLEEAIAADAKASGKKLDPRKEIDRLKEEGRYVLEVY